MEITDTLITILFALIIRDIGRYIGDSVVRGNKEFFKSFLKFLETASKEPNDTSNTDSRSDTD